MNTQLFTSPSTTVAKRIFDESFRSLLSAFEGEESLVYKFGRDIGLEALDISSSALRHILAESRGDVSKAELLSRCRPFFCELGEGEAVSLMCELVSRQFHRPVTESITNVVEGCLKRLERSGHVLPFGRVGMLCSLLESR